MKVMSSAIAIALLMANSAIAQDGETAEIQNEADVAESPSPTPTPTPNLTPSMQHWGFGPALALTFDLGSNDRVDEASLDPNGIVRVQDEENVTGRFLLELHHFWTPFPSKSIGVGPFVAVEAGSDPIIQGLGGGVMVGFKTRESADGRAESFNIGLGIIYDLDSQVLGDGIEPNQPLPPGETEIRYKETEQSGFMIISSYRF